MSKRKTALILFFLIAIFGLLAVLTYKIHSILKPQVVLREVSQRIGFQIKAQKINFSWNGKVELKNLKISENKEVFLKIKELQAGFNLLKILFSGRASIDSLTLYSPIFNLNSKILSEISKKLKKSPSSAQVLPLFVSNGTLFYRLSNGKMIHVQGVFGNLNLANGEAEVDLQFQILKGGKYRLSGMIGSKTIKLKGALTNVSLNEIAKNLSLSSFPNLPIKVTGNIKFYVKVHPLMTNLSFQFPSTILNHTKLKDLKGTITEQRPHLLECRIFFPVSNQSLFIHGTVNLTDKRAHLVSELNGEKISKLLQLFDGKVQSVDGNLYGECALKGKPGGFSFNFSGTGRNLIVSGEKIGTAKIDAEFSPSKTGYNGHLKSALSVSQVPAFQKEIPGISGNLFVSLLLIGSHPQGIQFSFTNGTLGKKALPNLTGEMRWNSPVASFSPLTLSSLSPPLNLYGNENIQSQSIQLNGTFKGQSFQEIFRLLGSSKTNLTGTLLGPLKIQGLTHSPNFSFQGRALNLIYKGISLGNGNLELRGNLKQIQGKLTLDKPVSAESVVTKKMPQVYNLLNQFVKIPTITAPKMSGATISGNPNNPNVVPTFTSR
jgi:hypothetical protein